MRRIEPFQLAFYLFLVISVILGCYAVYLHRQLNWAEHLIGQDGMMEDIYQTGRGK